ncbi:MAG: gliding motility-associated C-terminal domain-containing protein [Saprospiraceae bacterium]|uniref:Gliding motility-associated C-terminal domain-containing protein n=1 Tax=Candidatus Opimibacter skivensis TaxID=2982028 RepID=A0A9D7SWT0_9BACT|nr:gliding motility-associated C-terminal domain-containing protein [Candidatus Opimibacter skivensis]
MKNFILFDANMMQLVKCFVSMSREFRLLLVLCLFWLFTDGQNIAPNPDFETFTSCPSNIGTGGFFQAIPWENGNLGTSDYFNACDISNTVGVPINVFGNQPAHSGNGYAGFFVRGQTPDYFEYIQAPLLNALVSGSTYHVSFYVNLSDEFCGTRHVGAYFSSLPPVTNSSDRLDVIPQIDYALNTYLSNNTEWMLVSGCFTAMGGEAYITIGNFHTYADTPVDPACPIQSDESYYYIDDVVVEEGPDPGIIPLDLGSPVSICTQYVIEPGIDSVSYHWEDGSTLDSFIVTTSGNYALTISDGCNFGMDSVAVTILGNPQSVEIGTDSVTICSGDHFDISLDPNWNYVWSDGTTSPDISLTTTGSYSVTLDDGCDISADTIVLNVLSPPPPFSLGIDTAICQGSIITYSFDPTWGQFIWQDATIGSLYEISSAGNYALTVSNICGTVSDDILISYLPIPNVELGGPVISLCTGNNLLLNLDTLPAFFIWQDGSLNSSFLVTTAGDYSVTASNACGFDTDTITVDEVLIPNVDLGADITICFAQLPYTLNVSGIPDATDYLWQDGSTSPVFNVMSSGDYSVTVSNLCFASVDTIHIEVTNTSPQVILPIDQTLCIGDTLVLTNAGSMGAYEWNDHSTVPSYPVTSSGTYSLTVTNICGSGADTINVDFVSPPSLPDLGPDISLCVGQTYLLSTVIPDVTYVWQDGSTADTFLVTSAGTYDVQVSNMCGTSNDTIVIAQTTVAPQVDLGPDIRGCEGDIVMLMSNISGVDYMWQDGSHLPSLTTSVSGMFILTVSNSCGTDADTIAVDIHGSIPQIQLGSDTILCEGDTLHVSINSDAETTVHWQDGSMFPQLDIITPGIYSVTASNFCGTSSDTIEIRLLSAPKEFDLGSDTILCPGEFLILQSPPTTDAIQWQDGSNSVTILADQSQIYSLRIFNSCGSASDELLLDYDLNVPVVQLDTQMLICQGDQITLNVTQLFPAIYEWNTGSILPVFKITEPGQYSVSVKTLCAETHAVTNVVLTDSCFAENSFYVPNIFSPNGDDVNDVFTINWHPEIDVHSIKANIFDRWGNMVYNSNEMPFKWNGEYKGKILSPGVFVYRIEIMYFDKLEERTLVLHGDVTLIR